MSHASWQRCFCKSQKATLDNSVVFIVRVISGGSHIRLWTRGFRGSSGLKFRLRGPFLVTKKVMKLEYPRLRYNGMHHKYAIFRNFFIYLFSAKQEKSGYSMGLLTCTRYESLLFTTYCCTSVKNEEEQACWEMSNKPCQECWNISLSVSIHTSPLDREDQTQGWLDICYVTLRYSAAVFSINESVWGWCCSNSSVLLRYLPRWQIYSSEPRSWLEEKWTVCTHSGECASPAVIGLLS